MNKYQIYDNIIGEIYKYIQYISYKQEKEGGQSKLVITNIDRKNKFHMLLIKVMVNAANIYNIDIVYDINLIEKFIIDRTHKIKLNNKYKEKDVLTDIDTICSVLISMFEAGGVTPEEVYDEYYAPRKVR